MDLYELVARRRMVRKYVDKPVDPRALERIVTAARRAPSAGFTQGHYLVVVTEQETRSRIAELADEQEYLALGFEPWISSAPVHIVVCTNEADYHRRYQEPDKLDADGREIEWPVPYWWVDAGAVLMLLLLAAVEEELGAGFFGVHRLGGLKELLGIPEEVSPIGVMTLGHPAPDQPAGSARRGWKPLGEAVRWERF